MMHRLIIDLLKVATHQQAVDSVQKSGQSHQLRLVVEIPLFTGFCTSQVVVRDFRHQQ